MSTKKGTTWLASPHTIAKIDILRSYLFTYYAIIGKSFRGAPLLYIDGFAGPNKYENYAIGSPSAACEAIRSACDLLGAAWVAGNVRCVFVEEDAKRFKVLVNSFANFEHPRIEIHSRKGEFANEIGDILDSTSQMSGRPHPAFVFIDPFGAAGVPFEAITKILSRSSSEILMNLDADGIARNADNHLLLDTLFGDSDWRDELNRDQSLDAMSRQILGMYKSRLLSIPGVRYAYQTEMRGRTNDVSYFLLFAGKHQLGLVKMKEWMRHFSQESSYTFSDANIYQSSLLSFDDPEQSYRQLFDAFRGKKVAYDATDDAVTAFALNNTAFTNAKEILRYLEEHSLIEVTRCAAARRRGQFDKAVEEIYFKGGSVNRSLF